jgi:hypothetical protein
MSCLEGVRPTKEWVNMSGHAKSDYVAATANVTQHGKHLSRFGHMFPETKAT